MADLIIKDHWAGYAARTRYNAKKADLTVAFAVDYETPGERLTRKEAGSKYVPLHLDNSVAFNRSILSEELDLGLIDVLNVAGNGIYTLFRHGWLPSRINQYVLDVLSVAKGKVKTIISGGQTGVDIAGIVAAYKLGIDAEAMFPSGFMQRDISGKDMLRQESAIRKEIVEMSERLTMKEEHVRKT